MSNYDDDDDFRDLFSLEATTRLSRLGEQLLALEARGNDPELIGAIFREAHTLKGAAAVVGLDDAGRVAHALEDVLECVRSGECPVSAELVDLALRVVDGLTVMVPRLIEGQDCTAEADELEHLLIEWRAEAVGDRSAMAEARREDPQLVGVGAGATAEMSAGVPMSSAPATPPTAAGPGVSAAHGRSDGEESAERAIQAEERITVPVRRLDELVRLVGESASANLRIGRLLGDHLGVDPATLTEFRDLSRVLNDLQERTMRARAVPVSTISEQLHRAVRETARSVNKDVRWEVRGADTELDRSLLQQLADPLMHLVRNAVDHGIESAEERAATDKADQAFVRLHSMQLGSEVIITVTDDGRGIDTDRVREEARRRGASVDELTDDEVLYLVFRSGFSTARFVSDISGRGVGLDVVRTAVDSVRGRIEIRSERGSGTEFRIVVPITLAVLPCLLVAAGGRRFALPMHSVSVAQADDPDRTKQAAGREVVWVGDTPVPVSDLSTTLGVGGAPAPGAPVVVVADVTRRHAFRVDEIVRQSDVVVKGLGRLLPRLRVLVGASVEPDGSILPVLDAAGIIEEARMARVGPARISAAIDEELRPPVREGAILVVDDALTVRELQRSILERAGFEVRTAGDGVEALGVLAEWSADLVLTDVEMPRMDGFALTEAIRGQAQLANLPVVVLTSRADDESRQRGLEAGADGYIIKSSFDEVGLLAVVDRLLGRRA